MNPLNLRELILVVTGITLLSGFMVGYLRVTVPHIHGSLHWAIGTVLVSTSLLVYAFYPKPAEYVNLLITNCCAFAGQCLFLAALWKFKDKPVNYYILIIIPLLSLLATTCFTLFYFHMGLRVAINSILYAALAAFIFYEMLRPPEKPLRLIFTVSAFAVLIYALAMITRAVVSFQSKHIDLMAPTPESMVLFSAISLGEIVLTFGFIIMVNVRLSQDLMRQNAMKDKFFSIIAHDLKNPIGNIMGFSDLLESNIKLGYSEETRYISGAIKQSALQTNNLLENLLEWALSQTGKVQYEPEKINLRDFIAEESGYYLHFMKSKELILETEVVNDIVVWADKNMLKTIIRNLITNAIKYSHPGGSICVASRQLSSMAEISVADAGVGISLSTMEKLFSLDEKITTRGTGDEKGTGLGLVICREFVEKNKGRIHVKSEPGKGTILSFTLPVFMG
jgi:two-component system sensor histidine kinase/response regulator